jgi:outer membrane protein assembly factor BamB
MALPSPAVNTGLYYPTQHFDVARTGWNPYETTLTVATAPHLRQKFTHQVDGTIYAQPLYAHQVNIPGSGAHNVIYIATENDSVYAIDADTKQAPLWQRSLIPPGEEVVSTSDIEGCSNIAPVIGITSTPVMDPTTSTVYVVAKTKRVLGTQTTFHQRLYALDMTTGADRIAPAEIQGSVPGTSQPNDGHGHVVFDPHWHLNRPALLLVNGTVYIAFGSHCDKHLGAYHGWVFGYDASTLQPVGVFSTTPDTPAASTSAAGIWQAGMGLAADPAGFVYFTTGNGDLTAHLAGGRDFGDSVVKLKSDFTVADFFAPSDQPTLLARDIDLGSGGVLILPDPSAGTNRPPLLVTCGKDGNAFLINRNKMGKYTPGGPDRVVQKIPLQPGIPITKQPGVWGGPAYYRDNHRQIVYYCGSHGHLRAYNFSGATLTLSTVGHNPNQSPQVFPREGGVTANVSSNGQNPGTGVVWAITRSDPLRLQAFDATDLTHKLFDAACGPWHNTHGGPFIEPTTIQGKVYVPSDGQVTVFGL